MQTIRQSLQGWTDYRHIYVYRCVCPQEEIPDGKKKKGISGQIKVYGSFKSTLLYSGGVA